MKRKEIFNLINPYVPCFMIGEHQGECKSEYVVLKFDNQFVSVSNVNGGWQFVYIYCYTPLGNISALDSLVVKVIDILKNKLEFTGMITPEVIEPELKAYSKRLTFRYAKEV